MKEKEVETIVTLSFSKLLEKNEIKNINVTKLQTLWGGLGAVYRVTVKLEGPDEDVNFVIKNIQFPSQNDRKHISLGDNRKFDSYECEARFYDFSSGYALKLLSNNCLVPKPISIIRHDSNLNIVMELLKIDAQLRPGSRETMNLVISYLASFHATTWGHKKCDEAVTKMGLQPQGGYWYLDTRLDELEDVEERRKGNFFNSRLKMAARAIDLKLKNDFNQTIIHGDAKSANMAMFIDDDYTQQLAMYDFQYCGKACAMKDFAYVLCCGLDGGLANENEALEIYLKTLKEKGVDVDLSSLETSLKLAYADLCRWMLGWGYWGDAYALKRATLSLLNELDNGKLLEDEDAYIQACHKL